VPATTRESRALAAAVRELRARKHVTQEGLALQAGLGINYVSRLERGLHRPSFEAVARIAATLGVPLPELAGLYEARLREDQP
jgi:transcriptional regulator with XRE-family HTH domain